MHQRTASSQVMAASGIETNRVLDQSQWFSGNNCVRRHILGHNDLALPSISRIRPRQQPSMLSLTSVTTLSRHRLASFPVRHSRQVVSGARETRYAAHCLKAAHRRSHFGQDIIQANSYATVCCLVKFRSREFEPRESRPRKTLLHPLPALSFRRAPAATIASGRRMNQPLRTSGRLENNAGTLLSSQRRVRHWVALSVLSKTGRGQARSKLTDHHLQIGRGWLLLAR